MHIFVYVYVDFNFGENFAGGYKLTENCYLIVPDPNIDTGTAGM